MTDARFEDGIDAPLRLIAQDADGLAVISALMQDAVFAMADMAYDRKQHRFALLVNRFRWEDLDDAERQDRPYERVRALLVFNDVLAVQSSGIDRSDAETVLSVLDMTFKPGAEGAGRVQLVLAGDGAIALEVEALDATLNDVTRPYLAPSGKKPDHAE